MAAIANTRSSSHEEKAEGGRIGEAWGKMKSMPKEFVEKLMNICVMTKEIAQDDPRKVIHSLKVGLSISLVSLFYFYQPLYENFGLSAMWAVMTVVVVFEFTVGATLGKGLNRTLATLTAGALGVGAHYLASLAGETAEPILIGFFVFLQAAIVSFIRFFPKMKARYDYGLLIFILTFSLISVSGFRDDEVLEMAHKRLSTIVIGGTAYFINKHFKASEEGDSNKDNKSFLEGYKKVLNSKSSEDYLANFARWEPGHGKFKFRHPWDQYLKIGALTRQCAYRIEALINGHLNNNATHIQGSSSEILGTIQEACIEMSMECSKALKELGSSIKNMTIPSSSSSNHISESKAASKRLKALLQSSLREQNTDLLSLIPAGTVASLLIDIVDCIEELADSVNDLAALADFEESRVIDDGGDKSQLQASQGLHCECAEPVPKIDSIV
ncbi:hypothetical protein PIB30_042568 [Stylosanthes scabra]|uniref:Uncharacterized protein n=1 Tax=Stylosanthes scabra TaxID=79078 RepID=A0ABU6ZE17_9FABA|nr:hypothetical protein [Stylosanthes scabra]